MERLSHDLNLALEESAGAGTSAGSGGCGGGERRKLGLRRRTRSAGNLPAACSIPFEEGSSSSPCRGANASGPSAPAQQPLSDSDEGKPPRVPLFGPQGRNVESDSFNENLSPTRPPNARRKRKYKKMVVDYIAPVQVETIHPLISQPNLLGPAVFTQAVGFSPVSHITKKKRIIKPDRTNAYCGKRKWSVRERNEFGEMRERSFSGGCTSKSFLFNKKYSLDKVQNKSKLMTPGKMSLNLTPARPTTLQGSSSFNFVYKNPQIKNGAPCFKKMTGFKITTELPPVFYPLVQSKQRKGKTEEKGGGDADMDCNDGVSESSLSSSDSDGVVTCDSDREGDDELTDWPGSDEISVFNRTLNFKTGKNVTQPVKPKKEKYLPKLGPNGCKNRPKPELIDDEAMLSDSGTLSADDPRGNFTSFGDVKAAGSQGNMTDQAFFESFQTKCDAVVDFGDQPRTNFSLQKTSSSDLNLSEKSPPSDHCCGESCEVREIRAGCRRVRDERPGLVILSAANERLARFLQDPRRAQLVLPGGGRAPAAERDKLRSLATLYSLDLLIEADNAVLRKTSNTTQATNVDGTRGALSHAFSDYKRRCYGDSSPPVITLSPMAETPVEPEHCAD